MEERNTSRGLLLLAVGIVVLAAFIFGIAPFVVSQSDTFSEMAQFIDEHDVNTDAYCYTDSELAAIASIGIRSTIEHPPEGPKK